MLKISSHRFLATYSASSFKMYKHSKLFTFFVQPLLQMSFFQSELRASEPKQLILVV